MPGPTLQQLTSLRAEYHAEDVDLTKEMRAWSLDEAATYFASGGREKPYQSVHRTRPAPDACHAPPAVASPAFRQGAPSQPLPLMKARPQGGPSQPPPLTARTLQQLQLLNSTSLTGVLLRMRHLGVRLERVLDIGACKGTWSRELQKVFGSAECVLVEPIAYAELRDFPNVHQALLYSSETEVDWYERQNTGDSIFKERTAHFADVQPVRRRTTTLQKLLGNQRFDLVKLDVQGAELEVMKGGEALIRRADFVLLELPFMGQYNTAAPTFLEHMVYMDGLGFVPYEIPEFHREGAVLLQIDIVFVRRGHWLIDRCQATIDGLGREERRPN